MRDDSQNLVEKSYDQIAELIYSYKLPPNAVVSDFTLSKMLGISRTPIRQAILRLVTVGLVVETDGGFRVVNITPEFIVDLYEARLTLEIAMLRIAISKGFTKEDFDVLREIANKEDDALSNSRNIEGLEYDMQFHRTLAYMSKNERLNKAYDVCYYQMKMLNVFSLAMINQNAGKDYIEVIDCLEKGEGDKACDILQGCIEKGKLQKLKAIERFGDMGMMGIFNFIATYYESSKK